MSGRSGDAGRPGFLRGGSSAGSMASASDGSRPSTPEASSPAPSTEPTRDEARIFQLTWTDVLGTAIADVQPEPEPTCTYAGRPILAIDYSPNFAFTLGLYRALRPAMTEAVRTAVVPAVATPARLAQWLLLTAFTIRQCSSHYTAWSDRRELVLQPTTFWAATREQLPLPPLVLPEGPAAAAMGDEAMRTLRHSYDDMALRFSEVVQSWLPSAREDLPADAREAIAPGAVAKAADAERAGTTSLTVKALWHAIVWELGACGSFARMYHKNFQVWHHRQSMIEYGLHRTAEVAAGDAVDGAGSRAAALDELLHSQERFSETLQTVYGIPFDAIDERIVTAEVIEKVDSKNYHVWIHRSTFVHRFSFLVQGPPRERWRSEWLAFCGGEADTSAPRFLPDADWLDQNACIGSAPVPESAPIRAEFDFCARAINTDCFNNSAWCHRSLLLREDVLPGLLRCYAAAPEGERLSRHELLHVLRVVCQREVDFALQWAYLRPSNECAYVYARAVGELYQSATMRLHLHAAMQTCAEAHSSSPDVLLTGPLHPPVWASCASHMLSPAEPDASAAPVESTESITRLFLNAGVHLSWDEYLSTFELLRYQQAALHTVIAPLVDGIEASIAEVLAELVTLAETIEDPVKLEEERLARLSELYGNGAQYLIDNLYQVRAAMYHGSYVFLELTWLLYWGGEQRAAVEAARPPSAYAHEGVTDAMLPPEAWDRNLASACRLTEKELFLETEAMALSLAKHLSIEDAVRKKYWRHEARTVMQREY